MIARTDWQRRFDAFTAGSLPILETTTRPFAGLRVPVVRVDSTDRPDVRDMVRLLKQEREGSQRGGWGVATDGAQVWLVLRADIERPARCAFQLVFEHDRYRAFLESCARSPVLAVATEPLRYRNGVMTTPCIGLTYDPEHVAGLLAVVTWGRAWRRRGATA